MVVVECLFHILDRLPHHTPMSGSLGGRLIAHSHVAFQTERLQLQGGDRFRMFSIMLGPNRTVESTWHELAV